MSPLVNDANRIIERYENKKAEREFYFSPPPEKAAMGEFAFAQDVINVILIGVATGVLKDIIVHLLKKSFETWRSKSEATDAQSVAILCEDVFTRTTSLEEGIRKLAQQGIKVEEAGVAIDLLKEALKEELLEATVSSVNLD